MKTPVDSDALKMMRSVLKKEPTLTFNGFQTDPKFLGYEYHGKPTDLLEADILRQFVDACAWLEQVEQRRTINTAHTSYGYKHFAEEWAGRYICNGALIAAAIALGVRYKRIQNSPNAYLALSEKSLKAMEKITEQRKNNAKLRSFDL